MGRQQVRAPSRPGGSGPRGSTVAGPRTGGSEVGRSGLVQEVPRPRTGERVAGRRSGGCGVEAGAAGRAGLRTGRPRSGRGRRLEGAGSRAVVGAPLPRTGAEQMADRPIGALLRRVHGAGGRAGPAPMARPREERGRLSSRMEGVPESVKVCNTRSSVEFTSRRKMSWSSTSKRRSERALRESAWTSGGHNRWWFASRAVTAHRAHRGARGERRGGARGLVSRVLFPVPEDRATVISLGRASPPASNDQPGRTWTRAAPRVLPYLVFLQVGFADPPPSPGAMVRSYRTVSPLPWTGRTRPSRRSTLCCTFPGLAVGCR